MLPPTPLPCQVNASTTGLLKLIKSASFLRYRVCMSGMRTVLTRVAKERKQSYSSKVGTKSMSPMVMHLKARSQKEVMTSSKCQSSVVWSRVVAFPRNC